MRFHEEAVFRADLHRVWAVVTDWEAQARWMPDVAWVKVLGPERGLGARVAVRTRVLGVPLVTDVLLVTAWDPPRGLSVAHHGVVRGPGEWLLQPVEEGTRFTWRESLRMRPPLLGDVALWVYSPVQRIQLRRSLGNLRRLVESS